MSPKASPLLGYNNNVRHKGHVFHIQTEDSGVRYGHIITHLFMDGGRILKSVKTSYAEYVASERRTEIVREMMKQQHKAMFIALRDGTFDSFVEGGGAVAQAAAPARASTAGAAPVQAGAPSVITRASVPAPRAARSEGSSHPPLAALRPATPRSAAPSAIRTATHLPPPASELLREKTAAGVGTTAAPGPSGRSATAAPRLAKSPLTSADDADRRYAPTRPASTFGQARPQQGKTIFGEDPMSDKSLDEVILSYLSAELDDPKK
jgi:hypothetical protein